MRRKVTCTAHGRTGEVAALLIAQLDLAELVVVGAADGLVEDLVGAARALRYEPRVSGGAWPEAAGADVVVVDAVQDGTAEELARRTAGAVVVVASADPPGDVERLLEGSRLPRARILGAVADGAGPVAAAAAAVRVVDAILRDRRATLPCAVQCRGEGGDEGVRVRDVVVGTGGAQEIL
jgi:malate/lactate dehydrogenase